MDAMICLDIDVSGYTKIVKFITENWICDMAARQEEYQESHSTESGGGQGGATSIPS